MRPEKEFTTVFTVYRNIEENLDKSSKIILNYKRPCLCVCHVLLIHFEFKYLNAFSWPVT